MYFERNLSMTEKINKKIILSLPFITTVYSSSFIVHRQYATRSKRDDHGERSSEIFVSRGRPQHGTIESNASRSVKFIRYSTRAQTSVNSVELTIAAHGIGEERLSGSTERFTYSISLIRVRR